MNETYVWDGEFLKIHDTELGIVIDEPFAPLLLRSSPIEGEILDRDYRVRTLINENESIEEAYIEKMGKREGQALLYYPTGEQKMETFYCQGELHGPSTFYHLSGRVLAKGWFVHGKRQGKSYWHYHSGALFSIQRFVNGVWHGKQEYYYEDGTEKTIMIYNHGTLLSGQAYDADATLKRVYS